MLRGIFAAFCSEREGGVTITLWGWKNGSSSSPLENIQHREIVVLSPYSFTGAEIKVTWYDHL